jgi:tetratricopeptide (TPR) repeat protein
MTLANDAQRYYTRFDLRGEVTSAVGEKTVLQFSKEPYLEVTESQFGEVKARPFAYRDMFPLIPGEFRFRLVLKNKARSEYTLFETEIAVPDESTEAIALMTPVLLRGVGEASGSQPDLHRTYQLGSAVLEPNARRAYAIGEAVLVYVPVENATERHRLSFRVLSVDGTTEVAAKTAAIGDYAQKPIIETLVPRAVVGGHYRLSVALLDPSGQELVARSVDFDLSPLSRLPRPWALRESIDGEKAGLVFTALAEQALRLGEPSRARDYCRKAVAADPNLTTARLLLARFHLDDDQPLEAARLLEPAHVQNKEHIEVLATLGDAYLKLGRYSRAVELLEAALARRRPDARLLNTLAVAHAELGHAERAIEYLKRSLELDPAQEAVAALLARLQSR